MPTGTATSATERVATSSSTSAERNAIRSVFMVATRWPSAIRRTTSVCARARPNARSVGSPATMSRKCPPSSGEPPPLPFGGGLRLPAEQRAEDRDQRQGQRDDHRRAPVGEDDPGQHRQRHRHAEHQLRQVPGEVARPARPAHARPGWRARPARCPATQPGPCRPTAPSRSARSVGLDRGGDPRRDRALRPDQRRAGGDRDHEAGQRRPVQPPVDRGGQQRRERGGLRHDQPGGQHAQEREHGEVAPGRRDPAQQTRVERTAAHQYTGALPSVRPRKTHQHIAWKPSRAGSSGSATQPSSRRVGALAAASATVSEASGSVVDTST